MQRFGGVFQRRAGLGVGRFPVAAGQQGRQLPGDGGAELLTLPQQGLGFQSSLGAGLLPLFPLGGQLFAALLPPLNLLFQRDPGLEPGGQRRFLLFQRRLCRGCLVPAALQLRRCLVQPGRVAQGLQLGQELPLPLRQGRFPAPGLEALGCSGLLRRIGFGLGFLQCRLSGRLPGHLGRSGVVEGAAYRAGLPVCQRLGQNPRLLVQKGLVELPVPAAQRVGLALGLGVDLLGLLQRCLGLVPAAQQVFSGGDGLVSGRQGVPAAQQRRLLCLQRGFGSSGQVVRLQRFRLLGQGVIHFPAALGRLRLGCLGRLQLRGPMPRLVEVAGQGFQRGLPRLDLADLSQ